MDYELKDGAKFVQTFGGEELYGVWSVDDYGFQIGDLTVFNLKGEEFAKFVCSAMNHLMLNNHQFEFAKTGDIDLPIEMRLKETS